METNRDGARLLASSVQSLDHAASLLILPVPEVLWPKQPHRLCAPGDTLTFEYWAASIACGSRMSARIGVPTAVRWSQKTTGGNNRGALLRDSLGRRGWRGPAVDAVDTPDGPVLIDNTRARVALELGISDIPVRVHSPSQTLPPTMRWFGYEGPRFGPNAKTWGDALRYRTTQNGLPETGTSTAPLLKS